MTDPAATQESPEEAPGKREGLLLLLKNARGALQLLFRADAKLAISLIFLAFAEGLLPV